LSNSKRLLIVGAGGHGRVVADAAEATGEWSDIAFVDDKYPAVETSGVWPVIGVLSDLPDLQEYWGSVVIAIGVNKQRLNLQIMAAEMGYSVATIIHPAAEVSGHAEIGDGSVVFANAVVNIGSRVGTSVIVNTAATIDHDVVIGNGVHISPGAHLAGDVVVGDCAWIGIGASVINRLEIGRDAIIGGGASVVDNVEAGLTVVGVPARPISK
jgi:sugar O-acyltransferase (sialic acid O-acetyltransferase NeuD family)